jgi:uncharacterized protein DUF1259
MMWFFRLLAVLAAICASTSMARIQAIDWQKVDNVFGRKAAVISGDAHRYSFPRTDLSVTLDGVDIKPALALCGWVAFRAMNDDAMVMGDVVLLEDEINPVMTKLIDNGIEITALHNHLLRANPATFYLHIGGMGDPVKMATAIRTALAQSKTPLAAPAASTPPPIELDTAQLDQIIGVKGQANGGVYQFGVQRRDPATEKDAPITPPGPLGMATGIGFQPTGGGKAAIAGDLVLTADEVSSGPTTTRSNSLTDCVRRWTTWLTRNREAQGAVRRR